MDSPQRLGAGMESIFEGGSEVMRERPEDGLRVGAMDSEWMGEWTGKSRETRKQEGCRKNIGQALLHGAELEGACDPWMQKSLRN